MKLKDEPKKVTEIREQILNSFNELKFVEEGHKYFLHDEELVSVSVLTHQYAQPFDQDSIAEKYALKHGETKEYWLKAWRFKNLQATTTGTLVHEYGESLAWLRAGHPELITSSCKIKNVDDWLIPTRKKEEAILKFWDDMPPNLYFVLAETKIYSGVNSSLPKFKQNYAGTFDLLLYYQDEKDDSKSGLVICDYKTNAELINSFSRNKNIKMLPPFNEMYNESLSFYTLQLSCYQIPLEDIGLKIVGRRLIHLKEDGTYDKIPLPNITQELRKTLS